MEVLADLLLGPRRESALSRLDLAEVHQVPLDALGDLERAHLARHAEVEAVPAVADALRVIEQRVEELYSKSVTSSLLYHVTAHQNVEVCDVFDVDPRPQVRALAERARPAAGDGRLNEPGDQLGLLPSEPGGDERSGGEAEHKPWKNDVCAHVSCTSSVTSTCTHVKREVYLPSPQPPPRDRRGDVSRPRGWP
jgi:hypothetical protein